MIRDTNLRRRSRTRLSPEFLSLSRQEPSQRAIEAIEIRIENAAQQAVVEGLNLWEGLWALIDRDDTLGQTLVQMSHVQVAFGEEQEIDNLFRPAGNGAWSLRGLIGRHSRQAPGIQTNMATRTLTSNRGSNRIVISTILTHLVASTKPVLSTPLSEMSGEFESGIIHLDGRDEGFKSIEAMAPRI